MADDTQDYNPFMDTPLNNYGETVLNLTNPEKELNRMAMALAGQSTDADGNIVSYGKPTMNDEGIQAMKVIAQAWVNQNCIMSNMKEKWIYHNMVYLSDVLIEDLMANRDKYGITNPAARTKIVEIVLGYSYQAMLRAMEQGEKIFIKGSQHNITTENKNIDSNSGGVFNKLMGWAKGGQSKW
jgi:hypothetical protein